MKSPLLQRVAAVSAFVLLASGCSSIKEIGLPWVTQGPGVTPEDARAQRQGSQAPSRTDAAASTARTTPPPTPTTKRVEAAPAPTAPTAAVAPSPGRTAEAPAAVREIAAVSAGYPQASRYGDLLFISGQIPIDLRTKEITADGSIEEQTRLALENLRTVLEANRLTMANVVSTTVYLKNINDLRVMDTVYERYFKGALPSRSVVEVSRLPRGALVEISAIAGR